MHIKIKLKYIVAAAVVLCALMSSSFAQNNSQDKDRQWQLDRDRYDLLDREKLLLGQTDNLSRDLFSLKQTLNALMKEINTTQWKLDKTRHELITVQMKLIK